MFSHELFLLPCDICTLQTTSRRLLFSFLHEDSDLLMTLNVLFIRRYFRQNNNSHDSVIYVFRFPSKYLSLYHQNDNVVFLYSIGDVVSTVSSTVLSSQYHVSHGHTNMLVEAHIEEANFTITHNFSLSKRISIILSRYRLYRRLVNQQIVCLLLCSRKFVNLPIDVLYDIFCQSRIL